MVKTHIGISLLAIKEICKSIGVCDNCPMYNFCRKDIFRIEPLYWKNDSIPDLEVGIIIKEE